MNARDGTREQALWTRARPGSRGPALDLLTARFDRHVYAPHAHDEFTVGLCVGGSEVIDYRGGRLRPRPGSIVVLDPGEMHTGGPDTADGYAYRALYAEPLTAGILAAFALILAGSVLATATGPGQGGRPVAWSTRQTSRADGRVDSPSGALPEERPGSTGQGDG